MIKWKSQIDPGESVVGANYLNFVVSQSNIVRGQDLNDRFRRGLEGFVILLDDDGQRQAKSVCVMIFRTSGWPEWTNLIGGICSTLQFIQAEYD